jgi:hypothetical protein
VLSDPTVKVGPQIVLSRPPGFRVMESASAAQLGRWRRSHTFCVMPSVSGQTKLCSGG